MNDNLICSKCSKLFVGVKDPKKEAICDECKNVVINKEKNSDFPASIEEEFSGGGKELGENE